MGNLTVKESGEMINFISPNVSNITSFKVHFSPRQEGSGDPSPDNVREITGWNGVEGYISNVAQSYSSTSNTLTTSIDWTEDVGTVYGGYVDLVNGELVQEYASIVLTGAEEGWQFYGTEIEGGHIFSNSKITNHIGGTQRPTEEFCTHFPMSRNWKTILNTCIVGESGLIGFTVDNSIAETVEEFTQFLAEQYANGTPVQFVYKIYISYYANYTTYQLTPQQLSTLKGQNNFWSNADYIEIEYELTETFDIQKAKRKIILNQPHIESASGDIVTFDTDMKGKLKECKVYFSPVQEGEGDPSPDNVRNIVGWNGVSVGLPSEYQEVEYVESTGEQWIDSDIECTSDLVVNFKMYNKDVSNLAMCGGIDATDGDVHFRHHCSPMNSDTNYWIQSGNGNTPACRIKTSERILTFFIDPVNGKGVINDISIDFTPLTKYYTTGQSYGIFGRIHSNGTIQSKPTRIYYFKFYRNDILIGNFIPCYRKSDNEIGMYDTVSKQFFTNQGTGTFLKGNDVDSIQASIDWTDIAGTVYGGYVDLISGELVVDRAMATNPVWSLRNSGGDRPWIRLEIKTLFPPAGEERKKAREMIICSKARTAANTGGNVPESAYNYGIWSYDMNTTRIYMPEGYTEADAQAYMENIQIVYPLAEPIHYQLTPQQILTLKGTNNIYSNTNGQTEIKYWKH